MSNCAKKALSFLFGVGFMVLFRVLGASTENMAFAAYALALMALFHT